MVLGPSKEQLSQFLRNLEAATRQGKQNWERTVEKDEFVGVLPGERTVARARRYYDQYESQVFELRLEDEESNTVIEITSDHEAYGDQVRAVYEAARDAALDVTSRLQEAMDGWKVEVPAGK